MVRRTSVLLFLLAASLCGAQQKLKGISFNDHFGLELLGRADVAADLKLSESQVATIYDLRLELSTYVRNRALSPSAKWVEMGSKLPPDPVAQAKYDLIAAKARRTLRENQAKRLGEIRLQLAKSPGLLQEPTKTILGITGTQEAEIEELFKRAAQARKTEVEKAKVKGPVELSLMMKIFSKIDKTLLKESLAVLTEKQRESYNKLCGKPFEVDEDEE